VAIVTSI
jgi:hypothetical protein